MFKMYEVRWFRNEKKQMNIYLNTVSKCGEQKTTVGRRCIIKYEMAD